MDLNDIPKPLKIVPFPARAAIYCGIILLMANINAIVDRFQHPHIPYFDEEHLIVGFTAGALCVIMLVALETYYRGLLKAINRIKLLESYLSICASCKKIRLPGSDPKKTGSWQPIESYISEKTQTKFSHGICPDCLARYKAELEKNHPPSA